MTEHSAESLPGTETHFPPGDRQPWDEGGTPDSASPSANAWSKRFPFLGHAASGEAAMTETEAISRNLKDFKAYDLHIRHGISSVVREQVLGRTRAKEVYYNRLPTGQQGGTLQ